MKYSRTELDRQMTADYATTMATYGVVVNQDNSEIEPYDINALAPELAHTLFDFWTNTPRTEEGHKCWGLVVASRQSAKTFVNATCAYIQVAFNPGQTGGILADKKERADDVFKYINNTHHNLPDGVRPATAAPATRKLTFTRGGAPSGSISTWGLNDSAGNQGIGRSWDAAVLSEVPFMDDAEGQWFAMEPAFTNRREAMLMWESTPAPLSEPSAEFYRDQCFDTMGNPRGRFRFIFMPFYMSRLNERIWQEDWRPDNEELGLLARFGPRGNQPVSAPGAPYLTLENLAFRRHTLRTNPRIRRDPQLFWVFFPVDPVSCWQHRGSGSVPREALARIANQLRVPWTPQGSLQVYEEVQYGAQYVLGVDPSGFGAGDEAAIQVLKVYQDRVTQVATYSDRQADPLEVARVVCELAERYNDAYVVVEATGVGVGTLTHLVLAQQNYVMLPSKFGDMRRYTLRHLYYHSFGKPGVPAGKQTNSEAMSRMLDLMLDGKLVIRDDLTYAQLSSYRRDKEVQDSEGFKLLRPGEVGKGRRAKHHWDRVSALLWACWYTAYMPLRFSPPEEPETDDDDTRRDYGALTAAQWQRKRREAHYQDRREWRAAERRKREHR